ncbi:ArsR/SmtB family transcription factor [Orenia marismortui]|uniref:ArsR family transcriptional regulator n=1 Tax=Orenia marismortui TaxID=46469 RepID=A0A4R8HIF7_9FIRM|nr:metalloregulator ArsR/SmtB family transcription factor [Orenia marismortui]TDX59288.1 ArsR family transcriptional regulator [Orenia marismortui]
MENITNEMEVLKNKAKVLKALSHPIRLCIVKGLMEDEGCNVSKMQNCLEIPQSTLSQHLAKLRNLGILEGKRNGVEINYYVINEDAKKLIKALF